MGILMGGDEEGIGAEMRLVVLRKQNGISARYRLALPQEQRTAVSSEPPQ